MHTKEFLDALDGGLMEKLYGFCYSRCQNHYEADDLCQEILLQLLKSMDRGTKIQNLESYCWRIAHNVYADFCENRSKQRQYVVTQEEFEAMPALQVNPVEEFLEEEKERQMFEGIMTQIGVLGKIYRDVMVLYYLEDNKISDIANKLMISETTVKQRLYAARNQMKEEVKMMDKREVPLFLKPVQMEFIGMGDPCGNDPRSTAKRLLSQNIVYLCRKKAYRIDEIAKELGIPTIFAEDEVENLCYGVNGTYGLLTKTGKDRYIANIPIIEPETLQKCQKKISKDMEHLLKEFKKHVEIHKEEVQSFQVWGGRKELPFLSWILWKGAAMDVVDELNQFISQQIEMEEKERRPFSLCAFTTEEGKDIESYEDTNFYGYDQTYVKSLLGYDEVHFAMLYGKRIPPLFKCEENIAQNEEMLLTVRSLKGLKISSLTEDEKEIAAKAIADGYLMKKNEMLIPGIFATSLEKKKEMSEFCKKFVQENQNLVEQLAEKCVMSVKSAIPKHLLNELGMASILAYANVEGIFMDYAIEIGMLQEPVGQGEGILLYVE